MPVGTWRAVTVVPTMGLPDVSRIRPEMPDVTTWAWSASAKLNARSTDSSFLVKLEEFTLFALWI